MSKKHPRICANCEFWDFDLGINVCVKPHAPKGHSSNWPETHGRDWCEEHSYIEENLDGKIKEKAKES